MVLKLKRVDELSGSRKRFRRPTPKAVAQVCGEKVFQFPMKAREGAAVVAEQASLLAEYDRLVAKAKRKLAGQGRPQRRISTDQPFLGNSLKPRPTRWWQRG